MKKRIKHIIIDPRFKVNYASYYLHGLKSMCGSGKMKYRCIDDISIMTDRECRVGFAVLVETDDDVKRVYIDYGDWDEINEAYYEWSDVYAKINVRPQDADREKLLVIGPSFGIKLWSPITCVLKGVANYRRIKKACGSAFKRSMKQYIMDYGYMFIRRKGYDYYHHFTQDEVPGYAFSFNTLWYGDLAHETTNKLRGDFMREGQRLMEHFDGGFFYIDSPGVLEEFPKYEEYLSDYGDMIYKKRLTMKEYDKRNRKSWFVFNTPSVAGCHGWKLAEFLCEGKAIISSHLVNLMPGEFKNGTHFIEANSREEMADAIIRLRDNKEFVQDLKHNAYHYFEEFLSPGAVMRRVFSQAGLE